MDRVLDKGKEMNTHDKYELPPLPDFDYTTRYGARTFLEGTMQAYARTAIEPYAKRIAELEADRQRRGEPVGYIASGLLSLYMEKCREPGVDLHIENLPVANRPPKGSDAVAVPIFLFPQPATPCGASVSDKPACGAQNAECETQTAEPVGEAQLFQPVVTNGALTHCVFDSKVVPEGTKLYSALVAAQPQPSGNSGQLPNVMQSNLESGVRPPEIQAAWHAGWDAALEDRRMKPVGRIFADDDGSTYAGIDVDLPEGTQLYAVVGQADLPVTDKEDEAWNELEKKQ